MNPTRARTLYERQFSAREDPWQYGAWRERKRHADALLLLERAGVSSISRALEVGCAEGAFTARLAPRCASLLALDFSATALRRAARRCAGLTHVSFLQWDLRNGLPGGEFPLIVVMDVVDSTFGPLALRRLRKVLASSVSPGGFLLFGNSLQSRVFETSWWGRHLLRGGRHINAFFAAHPELEIVGSCTGEFYVHTLFRRAGPGSVQ